MLSHREEFRLTGPCFSVQSHGRLFVVSALHCFKEVDMKGDAVLDSVAFRRMSSSPEADGPASTPGSPDPNLGDIAVFEVDTQRMTDVEVGRAPSLEVADDLVGGVGASPPGVNSCEGYPYKRPTIPPRSA